MLPRIRVPAPILVSSPSPEMTPFQVSVLPFVSKVPPLLVSVTALLKARLLAPACRIPLSSVRRPVPIEEEIPGFEFVTSNRRAVDDRRAARIGVLGGENRRSAAGDREHRGRGGADEQIRERLRIRSGDGDDPGRRRRLAVVGQDGHRQDRVVVERRQRTREPVGVGKAIGVRHRGAAVVQIGGVRVVVAGVVSAARRRRRRSAAAARGRLQFGWLPYQVQEGEAPIVFPGMFGLGALLPMKPKFSPEK